MEAEYEALCTAHIPMLKRYLFHKISNAADGEDVLQDTLLAAYRGFDKLRDKAFFKSWLIGIAARKCVDYYKAKAKRLEIPLDEVSGTVLNDRGTEETAMMVNDALDRLRHKDKQILYLFYIRGYNHKDIAAKLEIPIGTVKSRISKAKENFRMHYVGATAPGRPDVAKSERRNNTNHHSASQLFQRRPRAVAPTIKGDVTMTKFPPTMPAFTIEKSNQPPFEVSFLEISGWLLVPRVGEKTSFAFYDDPDQRYTGMHTMHCTRESEIHGIPCVQVECSYTDENGQVSDVHSKFMRMTDTHTSYVAEMRMRDNTFCFGSFYDDAWLKNYEIGENNIGREIAQRAKGITVLNDDGSFTVAKDECPDIFGRYTVQLNGRSYDTVAILEIDTNVLTIAYVDQNGRTVLHRRYNRFDWNIERYKISSWLEKLPDSEVLLVNGDKYVHWYDCISDYVM